MSLNSQFNSSDSAREQVSTGPSGPFCFLPTLTPTRGRMAELNHLGNVRACCPGCDGATSTYEWRPNGSALGAVRGLPFREDSHPRSSIEYVWEWRLLRCAGCGRGGLASMLMHSDEPYPGGFASLVKFYPEVRGRLPLPRSVPDGIVTEFREGEKCLDAECIRAAAGMFRSVLDKALRANGYKLKPGTNLEQQIDLAADDGVITAARKRRAHEEIRVLGNDVLHDEWHAIPEADVLAARHYAQRILEDFYDDRESVLTLIRVAGRIPDEDKLPSPSTAVQVARSTVPKS